MNVRKKYLQSFGFFVLIAVLAVSACKDSSVSGVEEEEIASSIKAEASSNELGGIITNTYISDSSVDTYDPIFPATADPNWTSSVCYQGNTFGINASWSNPHKAFQVTRDPSPNGAAHPWESNTFDAFWINTVNDMDSPDTKDINGTSGPGGTPGQDPNSGHNWSRYEANVSGNGDFSIQLLADNCSWVYLADSDGQNPQLIGYQAVTSTPGNYGVVLDGDHQLIFIIYDGGGLAGGKFRLETTENPPPPIEPEEPVIITYTSQAGIKTWEPIIVDRRPDFSTSQCTDDGAIGPHVINIDDSRWVRTNNAAFSTRGLLPSHYNNEFTFERAWNGIYGLDNFDADWINAKNSPWSRDTYPTGYQGTTPLPDGKANWTRYELPVEGNGSFELKLLADDCSWIYLDGEVVGYQDNGDLGDPDAIRFGLELNGSHTLSFIIFDQGGEAGGKFILETTTEIIPPYDPPNPNTAPVADAGSDQSVTATGQTTSVTLDGSGSSDADGDVLTYSWTLNGSEVSTSPSFSTNLADGSYTFSLTVSDGEEVDSGDVNVTVENTVPVANAGSDQTLDATGSTTNVTLNGSGSSDTDGDVLSYSWSQNGVQIATGVSPNVQLAVGTYSYTLTVTDVNGASSSDNVSVEVRNVAPEAVIRAGSAVLGSSVVFSGSGSSDANGDLLTYAWDFGDGNGASGDNVTHDFSISGNVIVTLTVTDTFGATGTSSVTVSIAGRPFKDFNNDGLFNSGDVLIPLVEFADGKYDAKKVAIVIPANTPDIVAEKLDIKAEGITVASKLIAVKDLKVSLLNPSCAAL